MSNIALETLHKNTFFAIVVTGEAKYTTLIDRLVCIIIFIHVSSISFYLRPACLQAPIFSYRLQVVRRRVYSQAYRLLV